MADIMQVEITHCCNMRCLANTNGRAERCRVCGGTDVNCWVVWECLRCGRQFENEDAAAECHPDEEE